VHFEWDPAKGAANRNKHGIPFEEAATAFTDPHGLRIPDPDHSQREERFLLLGMTWKRRVLVVSHCHRAETDSIRIISARKATRRERAQYEAGMK